ncbi:unnamed protein product [Cylicocyclus nassatus]|uniref:CBS domain-containing protein n=1 Tax=Cylicocyclus nassatus TaxID=53992 RepID=A0AA36HE13_CYLNA|nr:unnamed protein product [Cylicocyclus nassatus]
MIAPSSAWLEFSNLNPVEKGMPERDLLARLLMSNSCYEAMPSSGRVIIFDVDLTMWRAFVALITSESRHVLLSDRSQGGEIIGILSVTDFIRVILKIFRDQSFSHYHRFDAFSLITIREFREIAFKAGKLRSLVSISATDNLLDAVRTLSSHHVHRIPVFDPDTGNPIHLLTHRRILKFMWTFGQTLFPPDYQVRTPKELNIGTWSNIRYVYPETRLIECLDLLLDHNISGIPVVERSTQKVVDVYSRFDAIGIALHDEEFTGDTTVKEALDFKHICEGGRERVVSVRETDPFLFVLSTLVDHNVHRVCVLDENKALLGVISLSDVMDAVVVQPAKSLRAPTALRHVSQESFDLSNMELYMRSLYESGEELDELSRTYATDQQLMTS